MRLQITHKTVYRFDQPMQGVVQSHRLTPPHLRQPVGAGLEGQTSRAAQEAPVSATAPATGSRRCRCAARSANWSWMWPASSTPGSDRRAARPQGNRAAAGLSAPDVDDARRSGDAGPRPRCGGGDQFGTGTGACAVARRARRDRLSPRRDPGRKPPPPRRWRWASGFVRTMPTRWSAWASVWAFRRAMSRGIFTPRAAAKWPRPATPGPSCYVPELGWVGFDASNEVCPDERYIRLGSGYDAVDAAPIRGVATGVGIERLDVDVTVEQVQQ